ncbi:MarR family winged helix-turn-helix transcriptional regulator [Alcaligenaceae bacterium LF4-65]|uniref:MarR family winged helix-turn-helix transcriptional regulator n=1 Tax=Zwartia hollandica TaxID=324606 RepID=A0A953T8P8_9BURK|nr:MarR family winged helix-turn-helix transcriptional regulator [Zwartia hollandica]MBZ1351949.1 MarR family winged helix-turn-helix transcriptional regulator [Zwartia hollandica]
MAKSLGAGEGKGRAALVVVPTVDSKRQASGAPHTIWDRPGYLIRRLHQIHVAMFIEQVADGQVTPIQFGLLSVLMMRPGVDQATIGEEMGLDPANVAEILKRLEDRGLVSRVVDPLNRRRKLCLTTPAGKKFVQRYQRDMQLSQQQLLEPLVPAERRMFLDLLVRLVEANNESGRTSLRPGGNALDARRKRKQNSV